LIRRGAGLAVLLVSNASCAGLRPPPAGAPEAARRVETYSASLRVSLKGPELRARTPAIVAFRRPDALRVEVPGPAGPRLIAVARAGRLQAVFPRSRAVFGAEASRDSFAALFGIALEPSEIMDFLVGTRAPGLRQYAVGWGDALPRAIRATLPDGGRLNVDVDEAVTGAELPEGAFVSPLHAGYREVSAPEARRLWSER